MTTILSSQMRDGIEWIHVTAEDWVAVHADLLAQGAVRFEWLTATHNLDDAFDVTTCVASADLIQRWIVSAAITDSIATLTGVYAQADFHERETAQMYGVTFVGRSSTEPAFDAPFEGYPLRRDFALRTRQDAAWPGAVEPDAAARRRPSLPPGVMPEWTS
jgi:NADH-quinone oxidoreductase subunit C